MSLGSFSSNVNGPDAIAANPSVVPEGPINQDTGEHRVVKIGTYRLEALKNIFPRGTPFKYLMRLFGSDSSLPSPTEHWAVIVGDYYHELTIIKGGINAYENAAVKSLETMKKENWNIFEIDGLTAFNDAAIVQASVESIQMMPPKYDLRKNNCQTFVINLLNKICLPGRKLLLTSQGNRVETDDVEFSAPDTAERIMDDKTQHIRSAKDLAELLNYYEPGTIVDIDEEE